MKGRKAVYTVMIPQSVPGLAEHAQQRSVDGPGVDYCYLDRDKWAHWPGGQPELHHHLVIHADESPEMDSHVKQLARQVGQQAGVPAIFATKAGQKGPVSWVVDNGAQPPEGIWR